MSIISAHPKVQYLSIDEEEQKQLQEIIYSFDESYYDGVVLIQLYGKERWHQDGWFTTDRVILIDRSGLDDFKNILEHELTHNKCYTKYYGWDLEHEECFNEGLI